MNAPITVKSTFIDFDYGDADMEVIGGFLRQSSEPAPTRQVSDPAEETHQRHVQLSPLKPNDQGPDSPVRQDDDSPQSNIASNYQWDRQDESPQNRLHSPQYGYQPQTQGFAQASPPPLALSQALQYPTKNFSSNSDVQAPYYESFDDQEGWENVASAHRGGFTLMVRNIPNKYTRDLLVDEINGSGYEGCWDFLYLPIDPESLANKGYAFVNFLTPAWAQMFTFGFNERKMSHFSSDKRISVTPAVLQGFEANYMHYSQSHVNRLDQSMRPLFLWEPDQLASRKPNNKTQQSSKPIRRRNKFSLIDQAQEKKVQETGHTTRKASSICSNDFDSSANETSSTTASSRRGKGSGTDREESHFLDIKFCPFCGAKTVVKYSKFCQMCGENLQVF